MVHADRSLTHSNGSPHALTSKEKGKGKGKRKGKGKGKGKRKGKGKEKEKGGTCKKYILVLKVK